MVYNSILRQYPAAMYELFAKADNRFTTTISVLVSAVHKLTRSSYMPDGLVLYRGLGGLLDLPEHFFAEDGRGCRGYTEWGFMSTTSDKAVALQYSGVGKGRPRAMVMEMRTNAVDRGASIRDFSQLSWQACSGGGGKPMARLAQVPGGGGVPVGAVLVRASGRRAAGGGGGRGRGHRVSGCGGGGNMAWQRFG